MNRRTFGTAIAVFLCLVSCQASAIESGNDLLQICDEFQRDMRTSDGRIFMSSGNSYVCWGYMNAIQQLSAIVDENGKTLARACPPEQSTLTQLIRVRITRKHTPKNFICKRPCSLQKPCGVLFLVSSKLLSYLSPRSTPRCARCRRCWAMAGAPRCGHQSPRLDLDDGRPISSQLRLVSRNRVATVSPSR